MIPDIRGEFRVDVRHEDEVIAAADLPGVEKETVTLSLANPRALEITCERKEEKAEGYFCPRTGIRFHATDRCTARRGHGIKCKSEFLKTGFWK